MPRSFLTPSCLVYLYGGFYSDDDLHWWARIREWQAMGKETYVYFNNDDEGNAIRNADTLMSFQG